MDEFVYPDVDDEYIWFMKSLSLSKCQQWTLESLLLSSGTLLLMLVFPSPFVINKLIIAQQLCRVGAWVLPPDLEKKNSPSVTLLGPVFESVFTRYCMKG